ncbi:MAG: hypothetical protein NXI31_21040 [bacterium]|nr:hypothetical protein [bacterium]
MNRTPLSPFAAAITVAVFALDARTQATPEPGKALAPPIRLAADGRVIDTPSPGHAAPFVGDIDGDGKRDLLVGQFAGGRLTIYRNVGTNAAPRLAAGKTFQADGRDGTVPTA